MSDRVREASATQIKLRAVRRVRPSRALGLAFEYNGGLGLPVIALVLLGFIYLAQSVGWLYVVLLCLEAIICFALALVLSASYFQFTKGYRYQNQLDRCWLDTEGYHEVMSDHAVVAHIDSSIKRINVMPHMMQIICFSGQIYAVFRTKKLDDYVETNYRDRTKVSTSVDVGTPHLVVAVAFIAIVIIYFMTRQ